MNRPTVLLAFVIGCLLNLLLGRAVIYAQAPGNSQGGYVHACAGQDGVLRMVALTASCPSGQRSLMMENVTWEFEQNPPIDKNPDGITLDKATLEDINRRLAELEKLGCTAIGKRRVVAPFDVVDRSGKLIFSVIENRVSLFDGGNAPVAAVAAFQEGGIFFAKGGDNTVSFGINAPRLAGLTVSEQGKRRIELGKSLEKGNYRLGFFSSSDQMIAGLGQSPTTLAGIALVSDAQGRRRAVMEVPEDGRGRIGVMSGGDKPIAAISEGEHATGLFYACAAGGSCNPVMVSAGTNEKGVGVVATGPRFFVQGPTGALGSFLVGIN